MAHFGQILTEKVVKKAKNNDSEKVEFINNLADKIVKSMERKIAKMPPKHLAMWELKRNGHWTNREIAIAFCTTTKSVKMSLLKLEKNHEEALLAYTAGKKH